MAIVDEVINEMELNALHYMVKMYNLPPLFKIPNTITIKNRIKHIWNS